MMKKVFKPLLRIIYVFFITIIVIVVTLFMTLKLITSNISISAKELFVTTILETGQMKFLASLLVSKEEILKIVEKNSMKEFDEVEDKDLIDVKEDDNKIELIKVGGNSFAAKLLIVHDPSRVKLATIYPWKELGLELHELVNNNNAVGGVNGGLYESDGNKGGRPRGVVVADSKILFNSPGYKGLHIIGLDEDNILRIIDVDGMNAKKIEELIITEKIRDAVAFQEEATDKNNHFVKLIVNGKERELEGKGSGANPRTAIGQRKDGAILLLVTDGRGRNGHLGATAKDLIKVMKKYGAVNAANLDGGSSSTMYYEGEYEMPSITLYYSNSSWRLPDAFIIEKR